MNWKARPSAGPYVLLARTRDDREELAELREQMTASPRTPRTPQGGPLA